MQHGRDAHSRGHRLLGGSLLLGCATAEERPQSSAVPTPSAAASPGVDPAAVGANELGAVPVLMYHQFVANPRRPYDMTPDAFRAQLQSLYDAGYRPVTAADYAAGRFDLPAGRAPVVLTSDDSTHDQARIGPDGAPTPESALGILEAFERDHPDFVATATFFVNSTPAPFVDAGVLPWLAANGYEIGAHTHSHANLGKLDDTGVQAEIGRDVAAIEAAVPGYRVRILAVPFGVYPRNLDLLHSGTHDGIPYEFDAVFGVAETAAPSPFALRFAPYRIPRLDTGLGVLDAQDALARLAADPTLRYVSDGDPERISFPAALADRLSPAYADRARPY